MVWLGFEPTSSLQYLLSYGNLLHVVRVKGVWLDHLSCSGWKVGLWNTCFFVYFQPTFTGILDAILDSQSQTHGQEEAREKERDGKDKDIESTNG